MFFGYTERFETGNSEIWIQEFADEPMPRANIENQEPSGLGQSKMRVELDSYDGLPVRRCQPISTDWKFVVPKK
jgi:hypothetical protein